MELTKHNHGGDKLERSIDNAHENQLAVELEQGKIWLKRVEDRDSINDIVKGIGSFLHPSGVRADQVIISAKMVHSLLPLPIRRADDSHMVAHGFCYLHTHVPNSPKP